jgi:hypothetical protein
VRSSPSVTRIDLERKAIRRICPLSQFDLRLAAWRHAQAFHCVLHLKLNLSGNPFPPSLPPSLPPCSLPALFGSAMARTMWTTQQSPARSIWTFVSKAFWKVRGKGGREEGREGGDGCTLGRAERLLSLPVPLPLPSEDPLYRDNEIKYQWVCKDAWTYSTEVDLKVGPSLPPSLRDSLVSPPPCLLFLPSHGHCHLRPIFFSPSLPPSLSISAPSPSLPPFPSSPPSPSEIPGSQPGRRRTLALAVRWHRHSGRGHLEWEGALW